LQVIPALQRARDKFSTLVDNNKLRGEAVQVTIGTLSPQQAIGDPGRDDFALLGGREVMIEAQFRQSFGQAFTNKPQDFTGLLDDVLNLRLDTVNNRVVFIATLNAVCSHLGLIKAGRHCRNEEPAKCGEQIARIVQGKFGNIKVGMVGYQPAILENLVKTFGKQRIRCSDLDSMNIGASKFGILIVDATTENMDMIKWCDLLLVTSSTNVNNTFDDLYKETINRNKYFLMFGVTGAGISALLGIESICPLGK
jgi:uncharacterized protein (DUF4213/DUF364 family)